jgi:hypothetical protein
LAKPAGEEPQVSPRATPVDLVASGPSAGVRYVMHKEEKRDGGVTRGIETSGVKSKRMKDKSGSSFCNFKFVGETRGWQRYKKDRNCNGEEQTDER